MRRVALLSPFPLALLPAAAAAAPAALSPAPTFGHGGFAYARSATRLASVPAPPVAAVESAGRLVVVTPAAVGPATGFAISRRLASGLADRTFGSGGTASVRVGADDDRAIAAGIDGRGRILVLALADAVPGPRAFIVRLTARGRLDATFGRRGVAFPRALAPGDAPAALAVGADGGAAILATPAAAASTVVVARLDASGRTVARFGRTGRVAIGPPRGASRVDPGDVALAPGGGVVVATTLERPGSQGIALRLDRLDGRGRHVRAFGTAGVLSGRFDTMAPNVRVLVDGQGRIVTARGTTAHLVVGRMRPDGRPDATFGRRGAARLAAGFPDPLALVPLGGGGVGVLTTRDGHPIALAPLDARGRGRLVPVVPSGRIAVLAPSRTGGVWLATEEDGGVTGTAARLLTSSGRAARGAAGRLHDATPSRRPVRSPLAIGAVAARGGGGVLLGGADPDGHPLITALDVRGRRDASFGSGGAITPFPGNGRVASLVRISSARLVAISDVAGDHLDLVALIDATGAVDTGFGTAGRTAVPLPSGSGLWTLIAAYPDGDGGVRGVAWSQGQGAVTVFHVDHFGALAHDVGGTGTAKVVVPIGFPLAALRPGGGIALAGWDDALHRNEVVALTAAGALDGAFGSGGVAPLPGGRRLFVSALDVDGGGQVAVGAGYAPATQGGRAAEALVRLDATGAPLAGFGSGGLLLLRLPAGTGGSVIGLIDGGFVAVSSEFDRTGAHLVVRQLIPGGGPFGGVRPQRLASLDADGGHPFEDRRLAVDDDGSLLVAMPGESHVIARLVGPVA